MELKPSSAAVALIRKSESYARALPGGGCRAYPDPGTGGAPWTIGFGSTGPDIGPATIWTRAQAEARFASDLAKFSAGVAALAGTATQGQFDALCSFAYNAGLHALAESTLLRLHRAGAYAAAAGEFAKWTHSKGRVLPGLVTRRAEEAALYRGQG